MNTLRGRLSQGAHPDWSPDGASIVFWRVEQQ